MTDLCLSTMSKAQFLFINLFSDFYIFSSFILSHPLYFSYFIFFSPYLLKLISFLSPLFLTTSLLLLSILSNFISHDNSCLIWNWDFSSQNNMGFFNNVYHDIVQMLFRSKLFNYQEKDYIRFEDSDVFKIVFDVQTVINEDDYTSIIDEEEMFFQDAYESSSSSFSSIHEDFSRLLKESDECENGFISNNVKKQQPIDTKTKNVAEVSAVRNGSQADAYESSSSSSSSSTHEDFSCFLKESDHKCENGFIISNNVKEHEIQHPIDTKTKNVAELSAVRNGSKAKTNELIKNKVKTPLGQDYNENCYMGPTRATEKEKHDQESPHHINSSNCIQESPHPQKKPSAMQSKQCFSSSNSSVESSRTLEYNLSSYGSMRKEKEWKRTLACKLFEERHNVVGGGGEGMDMLWETYEVETSNKHKSKSRNKKNSNIYNDYDHQVKSKDDNQECIHDEDEEDDESNAQLCCLQVFKFSAGKKMNLEMKKPNIVKITKAIKGLGWLHHQVSSRRSKKVHNGE